MNTLLADLPARPFTNVHPGDRARYALRVLLDSCCSDVCVLDESGRFLGIVTDSELLKAALNGTLAELHVEQIMHRHPHTLTVEQTLTDAARLFRDGSLSRLPVLRGAFLAGIVRRCDVLRWGNEKGE